MTINHYMKGAVAALAITLMPACDVDDDPSPYENAVGDYLDDEGRLVFRDIEENAAIINGWRLNGFRLNGFRLNGFRLNGFRLNGFRLNGTNMGNPRMVNNSLTVDDDQNQAQSGSAIEDLRVDVDYEDPGTQAVTQYETAVIEVETMANGLVLNTLQQRELPNGAWTNGCDNGAKAIQLRGNWDIDSATRISSDPDATTWACLGGALGDCALWGYIPGSTHNSVALDGFHQSCLRLKRADYCGDGQHHTLNGHPLDVYDAVQVMTPEPTVEWNIEGFWNENGAVCLNHTRKTNYTKDINDGTKIYIGCEIPACEDVNQDGKVDFLDYPTAKMANKSVPADPPA